MPINNPRSPQNKLFKFLIKNTAMWKKWVYQQADIHSLYDFH
jgi:hypothetical protein